MYPRSLLGLGVSATDHPHDPALGLPGRPAAGQPTGEARPYECTLGEAVPLSQSALGLRQAGRPADRAGPAAAALERQADYGTLTSEGSQTWRCPDSS